MNSCWKNQSIRILSRLAVANLLLVALGSAAVLAQDGANTARLRSGASAPAAVKAVAAHWPLSFEENTGQVRGPEGREVRYLARGSGYALFLTSREAVLELRQSAGRTAPAVVRMRLSGSRAPARLAGREPLPGKSNYFLGNDPFAWRTGVPQYGRVAAVGVYPGIDLVYHGNQGRLEYDFDVAPHADPDKIRLRLDGARGLRVDAAGDLRVKVAGGEMCFRRPVAYQMAGGAERPVASRYLLKGKQEVTFQIAHYDPSQALVIDPVLSYSTYLGGSNIDFANAIAIAPDGTAFIAGGTFSSDFPTAHALQPNAGGPADFPQDAFVSKISADGSTLLYSTYLGGKNQDVANAIAVDSAGEAFVAGTTLSPDFPVTPGAWDTLCGGDGKCGASYNLQGYIISNGFVAKLNVEGSGLVYSSYLGGYENDECLGIAVDGNGNAYVTGQTSAEAVINVIPPPVVPPPTFPIINAYQSTLGGVTDAFVTRFSATGSGLIYSSYLGGSGQDVGLAIAADSSGDAYITGLTYSTNFPTSASPLQGTNKGAGDAFLAEVNTNLSGTASLLYSTYIGGTGLDQGNGIALDAAGNIYVTGVTTSRAATLGFTQPAGAYQPDCTLDTLGVCEGDVFVIKVKPASTPPLYFTYLGGSHADSGAGIAIDPLGDAYITGSTNSPDFPIAGAVFQPDYGGGNADAFVTELNPAGSALVYSTFLGGSNTDTGAGIAVDINGDAFVAGQTCSLDFPLSAPLQPTPGGNCDAFVSKIIPSSGTSLIPAGLVFPSQDLLTTSSAQRTTLTNGGNAALSIISIAVTGANSADFAENNTCGSSVPPLGTCAISVTFAPTSVTPPTRTAQITVTDSGPGSPQVVDLTGTAGTAPIVSLSSSSLAFGNQGVGAASTPMTLTVMNTGTAALTITAVAASGDFAVGTNNCAVPLQATTPSSNCTINVTYTPSVPGSSVGALTITDNAPDSPQMVLLTGTGVLQPVALLSTSSLTFASQPVGTTSAVQTISLTNTGTSALSITSIAATGNFSQINTCGATLVAGAACSINVEFAPTAAGTLTGVLTITDNVPTTPQLVSLGGAGSDFTMAVLPSSATVMAGSSTSPMVTVTPLFGYNAPVTLACTGLPALATCKASPASVTPNGGPVTATLTISTTRRTASPPGGRLRPPGPGWLLRPGLWGVWLLALLLFSGWAASESRLRWTRAALALTALLLMSFAACGGGGGGYTDPTGTPAGNYTVTVTGTSGGLTRSATLSLTVQ
jgi:hypothetical protein